MKLGGAIAGAIIGGLTGGWILTGALFGGFTAGGAIAGGLIGGAIIDRPAEAKASQKKQEKKAAAVKEAGLRNQLDLAGQNLNLTKEQMYMQMNQRKIDSLAEAIKATRGEQEIYTLPSAQPVYSPVQKINIAIDNFIRGLN